jgi:hypothetical protein
MKKQFCWIFRFAFSICVLSLFHLPVFTQGPADVGIADVWKSAASGSLSKALSKDLSGRSTRVKAALNTNKKSTDVAKNSARRNPRQSSANTNSPPRVGSSKALLKAREIANLLGSNAEEKEQLTQLFQLIWQEYEKETQRLGMDSNDLSLALSVFLTTNLNIYNDAPEAEDEQILALRDAITDILLQNKFYSTVTEAQKREMIETMIFFSGLTFLGYQDAKQSDNKKNLEVYRNLAGQNLQTVIGVPPNEIKIAGALLKKK